MRPFSNLVLQLIPDRTLTPSIERLFQWVLPDFLATSTRSRLTLEQW
jgi:hypothetical protein